MGAPTIDGHAAHAAAIGAGTIAATLTTTKNNDIVVAIVYNEAAGQAGAIRTVTGISGAGLTWTLRARHTAVQGGIGTGIEIWYALAASALVAQAITASFSGTTDDGCIVVFGVNGCVTSAPWDTNGSLPASGDSGNTSNNITVPGVSTDIANDLLIVATGGASSNPTPAVPPTGYTLIDSSGTNAGIADGAGAGYSLSVSAKQSGVSVTVGWGPGVGQQNCIVDALTAGAGGLKGGGGGWSMQHPFGQPGKGKGRSKSPPPPPPVPPPPPPPLPPPPPVIDPPPPSQPTSPVCPPRVPCPPGFWPT